MKKSLIFLSLIFFVRLGAQQISSRPAAPGFTVVTDTLHYYLNKYFFRTGIGLPSSFPKYRFPAQGSGQVSHCGSRFENADSVWVTGLEAYMAKASVAANLNIPAKLYLCLLNSSGMPVLPALDSVQVTMNNTNNIMGMVGGNLNSPRLMTTDFAVLVSNRSTVPGDTILIGRTSGAPANSAATPAQKMSDGNYSFLRVNGSFISSQNYSATAGFGAGTEYEFMVAPRVQYHIQASHKIPQSIIDANNDMDTLCTRIVFTFTNTSSYQYTNRFYNLLEFYRRWNLYSAFVVQPVNGGWPADSAITWYFDYYDNLPQPIDPRKFLPYQSQGVNHGTISSVTDRPGCWDNQFRAKLKTMAPYGRGPLLAANSDFSVCLKFCNDDIVSVLKSDSDKIPVFHPNPTNGTLKFNLIEAVEVKIMNTSGVTVINRPLAAGSAEMDISLLSPGVYLMQLSGVNSKRPVYYRICKEN